MKVFISWSGERSRAVAEMLNDWLRCVLQAAKPWVSTDRIDRGALWFNQIMEQLKDTSVGIICLTKENKQAPWILFEAGALVKGLSTNRVCTLLIDLTPAEIEDPLAQFNHTLPNQDSMWALVRTLNARLESNSLDERILDQIFKTYWNQFEEKFKAVLEKTKKDPSAKPVAERPERSILEDILAATKSLERKVVGLDTELREVKVQQAILGDPRNSPYSPGATGTTLFALHNSLAAAGPQGVYASPYNFSPGVISAQGPYTGVAALSALKGDSLGNLPSVGS